MKRSTRLVTIGTSLGLALVAAGTFGLRADRDVRPAPIVADEAAPAGAGDPVAELTRIAGRKPVASSIPELEARVASLPRDHVAWANLGIAYVDRARLTGDTALYPRAGEALQRSLDVEPDGNFTAYFGLAALAAARHDFPLAEAEATKGLAINPASASLNGILSDAQIQQGRYDEGFSSAQKMVDLDPSVASFARISYTHELTGDIEQATALMQRALDDATTGPDRAFALFHLGELSLGQGDPDTALGYFLDALRADPDNVSALSGKAHALHVSGQKLTSIDTYRKLIELAPLSHFLVEFGDFLAAEGRSDEAAELYDRARTQFAAEAANGARVDAGAIIFEADHGDAAKALRDAEDAVKTRPFLETHEAHAWALHVNGRHAEAVAAIERAQALGLRAANLYVRGATIRDAAGDHAGALEDLRTAHAIDPLLPVPGI